MPNVARQNFFIIGKHLDTVEDDNASILSDLYPDVTTENLVQYEKQFAIKITGAETDQERRDKIIAAHRNVGGLSKAYFENLGNTLGGGVYTVVVTEGTHDLPFVIHTDSPPASELPGLLYDGPFTNTFYHLTVTITGSASEPKLEELFLRLKPAWCTMSFEYPPA